MRINLHIDRLVLDGVNLKPGQQHLVQAGLEAELSRLLTDQELASGFVRNLAVPRVTTGGIQLAGDNNPSQLGQQIAQSVYGGIDHE